MFLNSIKPRIQAFHEYSSPYMYILTTTRDTISTNIEYLFIPRTLEFMNLNDFTACTKMTQRGDINQIGGKNLCPHFGQAYRVERVKLIVFLLKQMEVICSIIVDLIFNITRPF